MLATGSAASRLVRCGMGGLARGLVLSLVTGLLSAHGESLKVSGSRLLRAGACSHVPKPAPCGKRESAPTQHSFGACCARAGQQVTLSARTLSC